MEPAQIKRTIYLSDDLSHFSKIIENGAIKGLVDFVTKKLESHPKDKHFFYKTGHGKPGLYVSVDIYQDQNQEDLPYGVYSLTGEEIMNKDKDGIQKHEEELMLIMWSMFNTNTFTPYSSPHQPNA